MFWERASLALPAPLLSALRAGEPTDPGGVLSEYTALSAKELFCILGEKLGEDVAAS